MRRALSIAAVLVAAAAWGGAVFFALRQSGPAGDAADATGARAVGAGLSEVKRDVLGRPSEVRGDAVRGPKLHTRDEDFEYSPREVCLKMKLDNPEQNRSLDCSRREYDSPKDWTDVDRAQENR